MFFYIYAERLLKETVVVLLILKMAKISNNEATVCSLIFSTLRHQFADIIK